MDVKELKEYLSHIKDNSTVMLTSGDTNYDLDNVVYDFKCNALRIVGRTPIRTCLDDYREQQESKRPYKNIFS